MQSAISLPLSLLANERMNRFGSVSEFILMRSPRRAPPVFLRVGSVASRATLASGLSLLTLSMTSSTRLDLPAPPVPVIPTIGHSSEASLERVLAKASENSSSELFSAMVRSWETDPWSSAETGPFRESNLDFSSRSIFMAFSMASCTIPTSPIDRPSSGE